MQDASSKSAESSGRTGAVRLRFPKCARLLNHSDFERVYENGRRYSLPDFALFYLPSPAAEPEDGFAAEKRIRVGFTVPRALGGAVERNRIKRRMREAVRLTLTDDLPGVSADVVMNPRRSVAAVGFRELLKEVAEAFQAIRLGKGASRAARSVVSRKDTSRR